MTAMAPLRDILNNTPATAVDVDYNFGVIEGHVGQELINRDGSVAMTGPLSLPGAPTAAQHAATKAYVDSNVVPIGTVWEFAGPNAPAGWAFCDGSSKSTTDPLYAALFAVIGYAYGGAGANFNLPDRRGRVGVGRYQGDPLFGTLGARGGSRDLIIVSHSHTTPAHVHAMGDHQHNVNHAHTASSGTESADHSHSGTTDAQGAHTHAASGNPNIWAFGGTGTLGMDTSGTGHSGVPSNLYALDTAPAHQHNMSTGGRSAAHTHPITVDGNNFNSAGMTAAVNTGATAPSTDAAGVSGANGNLAPYEVVNFIVRIG
jgi:microcystin-dependent protein